MTIYAFNLSNGGKVPFLFKFLPPKWKFRLLARYGAKFESVAEAQREMRWIIYYLIENDTCFPDNLYLPLPSIGIKDDDRINGNHNVTIPDSLMKRIQKLVDKYNEIYSRLEQQYFFSGRYPHNKPKLLKKLFRLFYKILLVYGEFVRKHQYKAIYNYYLKNESRWYSNSTFAEHINLFIFGDIFVDRFIDDSEGQKLIDVRNRDPNDVECNGVHYYNYFNSISELANRNMPPLGRLVFVKCKEAV